MGSAERWVELPPASRLRGLALSESGFVFDPVSGNSFSVNDTGLAILRLLQRDPDIAAALHALQLEYEVEPLVAERDLIEFAGLLRGLFK